MVDKNNLVKNSQVLDTSDKLDKEAEFQQKSKEFEITKSNINKDLHQELENFYILLRRDKE